MINYIRSDDGIDDISRLIRCELSRPRWRLDWRARENLFQEVWSQLLSSWPATYSLYRPEQGSKAAYLRGVVRNIIVDAIRRIGTRKLVLVEAEDLDLVADDDAGWQASGELREAIEMAFESLASRISPRNLEILKRRLMNDESAAEIARALDQPAETIHRSLKQTKPKLRAALVEQAQEGNEALQDLLNRKNFGGGRGPKS